MGEIPLCASAFTTAITIPNNLIYFRSIMSKGAQCATIGIQTPTEEETRESDQLQFFVLIGGLDWYIGCQLILLLSSDGLPIFMECSAGLCKSPALASTHTATLPRKQVPFAARFPGMSDILLLGCLTIETTCAQTTDGVRLLPNVGVSMVTRSTVS